MATRTKTNMESVTAPARHFEHEHVLLIVGTVLFTGVVLAASLFLRTGALQSSVLASTLTGKEVTAVLITGEQFNGTLSGTDGNSVQILREDTGKRVIIQSASLQMVIEE